MLAKPVFKHHFHVEIAKNEDVVYLLSEKQHYYLKGYLYCMMADLLDGNHTVEDIVNRLEVFYPRDRIEAALAHLEKEGYIADAEVPVAPGEAAFWHMQDVDPTSAGTRLASARVAVSTLGGVSSDPFMSHLESLGIRAGQEGDFVVVLTDDYLQPGLGDINRERIGVGKPWLLAKPVGAAIWVGPLFVPGDTGCWQCLAHRLKSNRKVETALQRQRNRAGHISLSRAALPATLQTGAAIASTQVALCIADGERAALKGVVATMDTATLTTRRHLLTRRPQCPVCGVPQEESPLPLELVSRRKRFTEDGGHRIQSPAETLRKFGHLVSPVTGVVNELKPAFQGGNGLVSIYCGVHEIPGHDRSLDLMQAALRNNATGKGKSEIQSRASAFSEAVERYSSLYRGDGYRIRKSTRQMAGRAIPIEKCLLYSENQYQNREQWNRAHLALDYVPARLDPDRPIDWTPVWSLNAGIFKHVPTAHCCLGYYEDPPGGDVYFNHDSNGLAAGNVIEEAVLQGFFEVIERDCVSIWWYNRLKRPGVKLRSFDDPYFEALRSYYATLGREFWVLDLTSDSGIPTFIAIFRRVEGEGEDITFGCGTHFDARIGISRALTEMNQALYLLTSERTTRRAKSDREQFMKQWNRTATIENQPYLAPDASTPPATREAYSYSHNEDILDDIEECVAIAERLGLEILVHDLTQPDVGMSVVKVIVPQLRTFRARFAPGRLYDVPVEMGWRKVRLDESELNPISWWL